MTLTDLLPSIRQLSPPEKLKLIRILAEDLDTFVSNTKRRLFIILQNRF